MSRQERYTNTVYLPLRSIFNTNITWIRQDPMPDQALVSSIRKEGMQLPVLLRPDYEVIDGTRRLQVAVKLGWTEVPVLVTNLWSTVLGYFEKAHDLAEDPSLPKPKPMKWAEVYDLIQRHLLMRGERRLEGKLEMPYWDFYVLATGMLEKDVRFIRDAYSMAGACARRDPILGQRALAMIAETEACGGHKYTMLEYVRRMARGLMTYEESLSFDPTLRMARGKARIERTQRSLGRYSQVDQPKIGADLSVAKNLVVLLEELALQARTVTHLAGNIQSGDADDLARRMRSAYVGLHMFRRHLEARAQNNSQPTTKKEHQE